MECEALTTCTGFHAYGPGDSAGCYLHAGDDLVLSKELGDGKNRYASVCTKGHTRPTPAPTTHVAKFSRAEAKTRAAEDAKVTMSCARCLVCSADGKT